MSKPSEKAVDLSNQDVTIGEVKPIVEREQRANPFDFMFDLHHNPCFRQSMLWGIGLGATMGVHSAIRHRQQFKALNAAVNTFLVVGSATWLYCRSNQRAEEKQMRNIMDKMKAKQEGDRAAAAAASPPEKK